MGERKAFYTLWIITADDWFEISSHNWFAKDAVKFETVVLCDFKWNLGVNLWVCWAINLSLLVGTTQRVSIFLIFTERDVYMPLYHWKSFWRRRIFKQNYWCLKIRLMSQWNWTQTRKILLHLSLISHYTSLITKSLIAVPPQSGLTWVGTMVLESLYQAWHCYHVKTQMLIVSFSICLLIDKFAWYSM